VVGRYLDAVALSAGEPFFAPSSTRFILANSAPRDSFEMRNPHRPTTGPLIGWKFIGLECTLPVAYNNGFSHRRLSWSSAQKPSTESDFAAHIFLRLGSALLLVFCFGLAAALGSRSFKHWENRATSPVIFSIYCSATAAACLRIVLATKADAYYHSGYYPTIFDNNENSKRCTWPRTRRRHSHNQARRETSWGRRAIGLTPFGRNFIPNRHTHLDEGGPSED